MDARKNIIIESTLSGITFERIIKEAVDAGYTTSVVYLFLEDVNLCIRRVHERVSKGGHDVPVDDIIRRYYRSVKLFWEQYRFSFDRWHLYKNTNEEFDEFAKGNDTDSIILHEKTFMTYQNIVKGELHE